MRLAPLAMVGWGDADTGVVDGGVVGGSGAWAELSLSGCVAHDLALERSTGNELHSVSQGGAGGKLNTVTRVACEPVAVLDQVLSLIEKMLYFGWSAS